MFALIPARDPDERLEATIKSLLVRDEYNLIIVDYDADESNAEAFAALVSLCPERVTIVRHTGAPGKGEAMRTGLAYIKDIAAENDGVVTVSAVGRNWAEDVDAVTADWQANPAALVLGSYRYSGRLPLGKRIRTGVTRSIFAVTSGARVFNPYTGLRAFSVKYIEEYLKLKGKNSDYELNQLLHAVKHNIPIVETPIEVDNVEGNRTGERNWQYYRYTDQTDKVEVVAEDYFPGDGHCIASPNQQWMVTDSYPYGDADSSRRLFLYNFESKQGYHIGTFWADPQYPIPTRCDLHSRWSHDGKRLTFDSIHEKDANGMGRRRIYLADVSSIVG